MKHNTEVTTLKHKCRFGDTVSEYSLCGMFYVMRMKFSCFNISLFYNFKGSPVPYTKQVYSSLLLFIIKDNS